MADTILKAENGEEAIEIARKNPDLDLILMDIKMPVKDGLVATQEIRKFNSEIIIIAQTAFAQAEDSEKALGLGCNDYISKPINRKLLEEKILNFFDEVNYNSQ